MFELCQSFTDVTAVGIHLLWGKHPTCLACPVGAIGSVVVCAAWVR